MTTFSCAPATGLWARLLSAAILALGALTALAAAAPTGAIAGRVKNDVTGRYLNNARVTVEGLTQQLLTNDAGEFFVTDLPPGLHRVTVSYTGLAPETATVTVPAGATVRTEIALRSAAATDAVVKLDAFVVGTVREMSAAEMAINEKRIAPNIKEVVSTEEFGNLSQDNLGEFLKFLPGVEVNDDGASPLTVSLRGMPADQTNISVDGSGIAIPQTSGSARATALRGISMNNVSRIEVFKVPTPDSRADSLGGSINLISRSAFERSRPEFAYKAFLLMNSEFLSLRKTPGGNRGGDGHAYKYFPDFELNYVNPISKRLGVAINASQNDYWHVRRTVTKGYSITNTSAETPYLANLTQSNNHSFSRRSALGVKVDTRVGERGTLYFTYGFNRYWVDFGNSQMAYATGNLLAAPATGPRTPATGDFSGAFTLGRAGQGSVTQTANQQYQTTQTHSGSVGYRYRTSQWEVDSAFAKSKTKLTYRFDSYGQVQGARMLLPGVTIRYDAIGKYGPDQVTVLNAAGQPIDVNQLTSFASYSPTANGPMNIKTNFTNAQLNVRRNFRPEAFGFALKSGLSFRSEQKDREVPQWNPVYVGPDGRANSGDEGAGALPAGALVDPVFYYALPRGVPAPQWVSPRKAYTLYKNNPGYFNLTTNAASEYSTWAGSVEELTEDVSAAYLMGDLAFFRNRVRLVGGVRYERTDDRARGTLTDTSLQYRQDANGRVIKDASGRPIPLTTDPLEIAKLTVLPLANRIDRNYGDFYPSVNASWTIRENLLARFGYARTIGRPAYGNIIPTQSVAEVLTAGETATGAGLGTITARNPTLKPWSADNFDLTLEYYTKAGGVFSAGVFRKDIENFFGSIVEIATAERLAALGLSDDFVNYQITYPVNTDQSARISGIEVSARQRVLPWLSVYANASVNRTQGGRAADFSGYQRKRINTGFNLTWRRVSAMANFSYIGTVRGGTSGLAPGGYTYTLPRPRLDLSAEYRLTRRTALYAAANNVFNQPVATATYGPATPEYARFASENKPGAQVQFGVKGTF
jgi:TonB-dependent receptor